MVEASHACDSDVPLSIVVASESKVPYTFDASRAKGPLSSCQPTRLEERLRSRVHLLHVYTLHLCEISDTVYQIALHGRCVVDKR